jgi:hypothetical protein
MKNPHTTQTYFVLPLLVGLLVITSCKTTEVREATVYDTSSPKATVRSFFLSAAKSDDSGFAAVTARTPDSFWFECIDDAKLLETKKLPRLTPIEKSWQLSDEELQQKTAAGYSELLHETKDYFKINKIKLNSITDEKIYTDEAIVKVITHNVFGNEIQAFYLHHENEGWKIFLINPEFQKGSFGSEPIITSYGEKRQNCSS